MILHMYPILIPIPTKESDEMWTEISSDPKIISAVIGLILVLIGWAVDHLKAKKTIAAVTETAVGHKEALDVVVTAVAEADSTPVKDVVRELRKIASPLANALLTSAVDKIKARMKTE